MTRKTASLVSSAETAPPRGVLERALMVLSCFSSEQPRLHLREIAACTGLDKATLLRVLGIFIANHYVQKLDDGRYAIGAAVLRLSPLYTAVSDQSARIATVLRHIVEQTDESASFYARSGAERICIARVNAKRGVRSQVEVGHGVALSKGGAAAHILLAYTGGKSPRTREVLEQGYITTIAERDPDLASISLPVFEADGTFAGALVVASPISRQSAEAWAKAREIATAELRAQGYEVVRR